MEQRRLDNQRLAGIEGGLARSLQPSVYAASADDTLANLLPGGETVFSALSAAIRRDFLSTDYGAVHPNLGAVYVKSVSSDGAGGFRVTFVIDGRESVAHFGAEEINSQGIFRRDVGRQLDPVIRFFPGPIPSKRMQTIRPPPTAPMGLRPTTISISMVGQQAARLSASGGATRPMASEPRPRSYRAAPRLRDTLKARYGMRTTPSGTRRHGFAAHYIWKRIWTIGKLPGKSTSSLLGPLAFRNTSPWRTAT